MNIFLLAALVAATQAAAPFRWEFDFNQCHWYYRYQCFVAKDAVLSHVKFADYDLKFHYKTHPHVFAISSQSSSRWAVVMQTRSNSKKVNLTAGLELNRIDENKVVNEFIGCKVSDGQVIVAHTSDIETELIESYFDDLHLYCDFIVRPKQGSGKTLLDIVSIKDKFELNLLLDGELVNLIDDYDPNKEIPYDHEKVNYIASSIRATGLQQHDCDHTKVEYDPTTFSAMGKVRQAEYFGQNFFCPDSRYLLSVTGSKGARNDDAKLECKDGKYQTPFSGPHIIFEPNETINAVCYVKDKDLCPITISCHKEECPFVNVLAFKNPFSTKSTTYDIGCKDTSDRLVIGENDHRFQVTFDVDCKAHNMIVTRKSWYTRYNFKPPPTNATVGYCEEDE